jgi:hypothetical protein
MPVHIVNPRHKKTSDLIDTTSRSLNWSRGLSPFVLGPVDLPDGQEARNVENAWQYSKVYEQHVGEDGNPSLEWHHWSSEGFRAAKADRYPMGKGKRPAYSWWDGQKYGYIDARKKIYVPTYAKAVLKSSAFKKLKEIYNAQGDIWLWDFDGYDYEKEGMSLLDVLDCDTRKMGHCFVLALLLTPQVQWGRKRGDGSEDASPGSEPGTSEGLERLCGGEPTTEAPNLPEYLPELEADAPVLPDVVCPGSVVGLPHQGGGGAEGQQGDCGSDRLSREKLRAIIVERLFDTLENRGSVAVYHNEGVLRGMIWGLIGYDPGHLNKTAKILKMLDVPYELTGSGDVIIPEEWLKENGIDADPGSG